MLDTDDTSSLQLHQDLQQSVVDSLATGRPLLTHWNADTTWSLSFAYPAHEPRPPGRSRYNILIDPWLAGPQSDFAGWFSTQWHATQSSVQTIAELEAGLKEVETLMPTTQVNRPNSTGKTNGESKSATSYIDAVVVSHEFTDHCHQGTLLEVKETIPVFATQKAATLIRSWKHFDNVLDIASFTTGTDWRKTSRGPLPSWLGIARLVTKSDALYYHSAVIICSQDPAAPDEAEAVIYTPHGVHAQSFETLWTAQPPVKTLAFLHGLHDVSIALSKQLNLGARNALQAQDLLHSKYWVGTHDEVKIGGGLVTPFLRRKAYTILDVIGGDTNKDAVASGSPKGVSSYVDLCSGESLLLE